MMFELLLNFYIKFNKWFAIFGSDFELFKLSAKALSKSKRGKLTNCLFFFFGARLPAFVVSSLKSHISNFGTLPLSVKVVPFEFQYLYFQFLIFQVRSLFNFLHHSL